MQGTLIIYEKQPVTGFPTSYLVVLFMFNKLRWYVVVRSVDIGVELLTSNG